MIKVLNWTSTSSLRNEAVNAKNFFVPELSQRLKVILEELKFLGGHIGGVTPVPIPNTAVKPT